MSAPTVQSVEQIVADLNPAYSGSIDVLNKRRAALPGQFQAQRSGLEAEKVVGFNQINNQATGRGMSFSGIPLDEQANYLSTKYLPGLQQLALQENEQNLALDEALAGINKERRLKAMDIRSNQQSALERYLAEERERAWQREKFAAEQAMERAKMAQQASTPATATPSLNANIRSYLDNYADTKTGKVPLAVWKNAVRMAHESGMKFGGDQGFASTFWNYADDKNWKAYQTGYDRWMK